MSRLHRKDCLFSAVNRRIEMNDRIFCKKITIGIELKIIAGLIEQHDFGILQVLPHRQFCRVRIFTDQCFENLIMVITPVIDGTCVDMLVQFFQYGLWLRWVHIFSTMAASAEFCVASAT